MTNLKMNQSNLLFDVSQIEFNLQIELMVITRAGTWAVTFLGGPWHDHLARPKARHSTKYFGPCRHDTNTRAVPCLESQHDGLYGTTRILGRAWAGTARKHPIGHYVALCSIMTVNLPF